MSPQNPPAERRGTARRSPSSPSSPAELQKSLGLREEEIPRRTARRGAGRASRGLRLPPRGSSRDPRPDPRPGPRLGPRPDPSLDPRPDRTHAGPTPDPRGTHGGPTADPRRTHAGPTPDPRGTHAGPTPARRAGGICPSPHPGTLQRRPGGSSGAAQAGRATGSFPPFDRFALPSFNGIKASGGQAVPVSWPASLGGF